ncbi:hypothetical protein HK099_000661, partial [Clydaea vesicula]
QCLECLDSLEVIEYQDKLKSSKKNFKEKKLQFDDLFGKSEVLLIDEEGGVSRCGNCHWEVVDRVCVNCETVFDLQHNFNHNHEALDEDSDAYDSQDNLIPIGNRGEIGFVRRRFSHNRYEVEEEDDDSFVTDGEEIVEDNSNHDFSSDFSDVTDTYSVNEREVDELNDRECVQEFMDLSAEEDTESQYGSDEKEDFQEQNVEEEGFNNEASLERILGNPEPSDDDYEEKEEILIKKSSSPKKKYVINDSDSDSETRCNAIATKNLRRKRRIELNNSDLDCSSEIPSSNIFGKNKKKKRVKRINSEDED